VPDPSDGRAKHVRLTPLARKAFARMSAETHKVLSRKAKG
jgi:DNA-binding MarR family transcriptional regulator